MRLAGRPVRRRPDEHHRRRCRRTSRMRTRRAPCRSRCGDVTNRVTAPASTHVHATTGPDAGPTGPPRRPRRVTRAPARPAWRSRTGRRRPAASSMTSDERSLSTSTQLDEDHREHAATPPRGEATRTRRADRFRRASDDAGGPTGRAARRASGEDGQHLDEPRRKPSSPPGGRRRTTATLSTGKETHREHATSASSPTPRRRMSAGARVVFVGDSAVMRTVPTSLTDRSPWSCRRNDPARLRRRASWPTWPASWAYRGTGRGPCCASRRARAAGAGSACSAHRQAPPTSGAGST